MRKIDSFQKNLVKKAKKNILKATFTTKKRKTNIDKT